MPQALQPGQLRWRCRRGMKELDLLLSGYLVERWSGASTVERAAFERILELPDPLLAAYLMEREVPSDPALFDLLAILRGHAAARLATAATAAAASGLPQP
jgi:antitoxin CptB